VQERIDERAFLEECVFQIAAFGGDGGSQSRRTGADDDHVEGHGELINDEWGNGEWVNDGMREWMNEQWVDE
jgi:hypothetical protein